VPQLLSSVLRSTQLVPAPQFVKPGVVQAQSPPTQVVSQAEHTFPQLPQLSRLLLSSTHASEPAQYVSEAVRQSHTPLTHDCP
jgi:hypothetical protein